MSGIIWWIRQLVLIGLGSFFLYYGVKLLISSYDLNDPYTFLMTFFASNFIILISAALVVGFAYRMVAVYRQSNDQQFHDQVGFLTWEPATGLISHSFVIPRGVGVVAGGKVVEEHVARGVEERHASVGEVDAGALRLARFNLPTSKPERGWFAGVPITAAGGGLCSSLVLVLLHHEQVAQVMPLKLYLPVLLFVLAILMISRIRYPHVFNQLFRGRRNFQHLVQLIFALVVIFVLIIAAGFLIEVTQHDQRVHQPPGRHLGQQARG